MFDINFIILLVIGTFLLGTLSALAWGMLGKHGAEGWTKEEKEKAYHPQRLMKFTFPAAFIINLLFLLSD